MHHYQQTIPTYYQSISPTDKFIPNYNNNMYDQQEYNHTPNYAHSNIVFPFQVEFPFETIQTNYNNTYNHSIPYLNTIVENVNMNSATPPITHHSKYQSAGVYGSNVHTNHTTFTNTNALPTFNIGFNSNINGNYVIDTSTQTLISDSNSVSTTSTTAQTMVCELPNGQWKCLYDGCNKHFKHKTNAIIHYKIHTDEAIVCCDPYCKKKFARRSNMLQHYRVHSGIKPFKCNQCTKCFKQKHSLKEHKARAHSGIKPFECVICKKRFGCNADLKCHLRNHQRMGI